MWFVFYIYEFCRIIVLAQPPKLYVGSACNKSSSGIPCRIINSLCMNDVCVCADLHRPSNDGLTCVSDSVESGILHLVTIWLWLDSLTLDEPCAFNDDCHGLGQYCSLKGKCQCSATHVRIDGGCKNGKRELTTRLQFPITVIHPGQRGCDDSRQCSQSYPGSLCQRRVCECPDDLVVDGQTCVMMKKKKMRHKTKEWHGDFCKFFFSKFYLKMVNICLI